MRNNPNKNSAIPVTWPEYAFLGRFKKRFRKRRPISDDEDILQLQMVKEKLLAEFLQFEDRESPELTGTAGDYYRALVARFLEPLRRSGDDSTVAGND